MRASARRQSVQHAARSQDNGSQHGAMSSMHQVFRNDHIVDIGMTRHGNAMIHRHSPRVARRKGSACASRPGYSGSNQRKWRLTASPLMSQLRMRPTPRDLALMVIVSLVLTGVVPNEAYPADITLISVGPRLGFSGQTFLGREQKYNFRLYDVAAVFRLPWAWSLAESGWGVETRLITSVGLLAGAGDTE